MGHELKTRSVVTWHVAALCGLAASATGLTHLSPAAAADELSGADQLRALYSAEFRFTDEGVPIVPVAIAEGVEEVTVSAEGGLRLLPQGDDGPELTSTEAFRVTAARTRPAKLRFWPVVYRAKSGPGVGAEAARRAASFTARSIEAKVFELGTLFAVAGEVLDRREIVVGVNPAATPEAAEKALERLRASESSPVGGIYTEMVERPHGDLLAVGKTSAVRLRNEGALWFAPMVSPGSARAPSAGVDRPLRVEGRKAGGVPFQGIYHGRLLFTIGRKGSLVVVNAVPENRLLAGLVPAEIFASAPDEALKAQAIAARGELLAKIGARHIGEPFRLCAETHCQVYAGAARETPRTTAAVEATRGEVLFEAGGKELVDTVYSANCGGHTEHNENAWADTPAHPALRGHFDGPAAVSGTFAGGVTAANIERFLSAPPPAYCAQVNMPGTADRFRWTVTRSAAEMDRLLAGHSLGRVRAIEVTERGVSGRARTVNIVGATKSEIVRGELRIRQLFGNLRSSLFVADVDAGAVRFRGGGFGHGVGLCQTGSIGMAEAHKTYREILQHYYQGSVLRKLW
jgi:stage II sporulation protein D